MPKLSNVKYGTNVVQWSYVHGNCQQGHIATYLGAWVHQTVHLIWEDLCTNIGIITLCITIKLYNEVATIKLMMKRNLCG